MRANRRKFGILAAGIALTLVLSANGSALPDRPDRLSASKDTLVFGAEQAGGPDWCLNTAIVYCSSFWNGMFEAPVIRGAFLYTPQFTYKPDLISRYRLKLRPMRVTYYIRKNAHWSDGVQVTAKDWRFTWQELMANKLNINPAGWEDIRSVTGNGKVASVTFSKPYAGWRDLFSYVLPAHALAGSDFVNVWSACICNPKRDNTPISDGPFLLTKFDRGTGITLTRNSRGWHGRPAKLHAIVFRFIQSTGSEIQAIRSGELDAIYPQPQLALAGLRHEAGLRVVSHLGLNWELISIEERSRGNPLAKERWLRQALMLSLDRKGAAKALYGTLDPKIPVLNSATRLTNEPTYDPTHFSKWNYNPAKAQAIMRAHNCTKGGDGIYTCSGTRVSFDFSSTADNPGRKLTFTILQAQAASAGIELRYAFLPAGEFFQNLNDQNYQLGMFAAVVGIDPHYVVDFFRCNPKYSLAGYCNRTVDRLLLRSDRELNETKRLALINRAGVIIGNDVPLVPLFQRPTFLVYRKSVKGMVDNPSTGTPSFNAENWSKR
jgi:peptide/nickel transport system substrate-binding protein